MVPLLARQSVIIKAGRENNTILGNYECAYGLGIMSKLSGIELLEEHTDMVSLHRDFCEKLKDYQPADEKQTQLKKILLRYKPTAGYDEQMEELLQWGLKEDKVWQI